jgi:3-methyladenine DNA glycosylase AlkC
MQVKEKFSLKDHLFNESKVTLLSNSIKNVYPKFNNIDFNSEVLSAFPNLELKQRIAHIRFCLQKYLPQNYVDAVNIILKSLPEPLDENNTDDDFGDFIYAPYGDFVAQYGCSKINLTFSLAAIKEITKRFSAEYAIRYFINKYPTETITTLQKWSKDKNYHVRRLCSEGTRPKLPWAQKINIPNSVSISILDELFTDKTRFVTRSVANHLNDISKENPTLVLDKLRIWQTSGKQNNNEMNFIIKHSLRTLIKNGNKEAIKMLGFDDSDGISINSLMHDDTVKINDYLSFSFKLGSQKSKKVIVDYVLYFQNKFGKLDNKKVFKLQTFSIKSDQTKIIQKRHFFKGDMTTRKLYIGLHKIDIQVNGKILGSFDFNLID